MLPRMTQALEPPPATQQADAPIVRAVGVRKTFRMGDASVEVLKGVDLDVRPGEFLAIEGRSGSGKSTLLHLLGALDEPDAGSIRVQGRDLMEMGGKERSRVRNRACGFVFQFYHLLPELNVLENTLLAAMVQHSWIGFRSNRRELKSRAADLLNRLGLGHRLSHRPNQLSGGERQRVAIARALMNDPPLLLADEPTGNLDFDTGREIMAVLEGLHRDHGQTVVMVTHDRTLARAADRSMVLVEGKLDE